MLAVIEWRARFDEAANIELANHLQEAGAQVVYGIEENRQSVVEQGLDPYNAQAWVLQIDGSYEPCPRRGGGCLHPGLRGAAFFTANAG